MFKKIRLTLYLMGAWAALAGVIPSIGWATSAQPHRLPETRLHTPYPQQTTLFREQLMAVVAAMDSVKPLLETAQKTQPEGQAVTLHVHRWTDSEGHRHPGIAEDLQAIENALLRYLKNAPVSPRQLPALRGDFLSGVPLPALDTQSKGQHP